MINTIQLINLPPEIHGLVCIRYKGKLYTNIRQRKVYHSPTGFEIGYGGSGPADLALNTLLHFTDEDTAMNLYQKFKWEYIANMDYQGGSIPAGIIREFILKEEK